MFNKQFWKDEAISFIQTMLTFFAIDAAVALMTVYNGFWDKMVLVQLGTALLRSVVKTLLTLVFPALFPRRRSIPNPLTTLPPEN